MTQKIDKIDIDASAKKINAAYRSGVKLAVEGIIEVGKTLLAEKKAMPHGSFLTMMETKLDFSVTTAQRFMKIAEHPILSKKAHVLYLPPSWGTLAQLASPKITEAKLIKAIEDGTVNPDMERADVAKLLPKPKAKSSGGDTSSKEKSSGGNASGKEKSSTKKTKAHKPEDRPDDPMQEDCEDCDTPEQFWQRSLGSMTGDIIAMRAFWTRQFGKWEKFEVTSQLVQLAKQAAEVMAELASDLAKKEEAQWQKTE